MLWMHWLSVYLRVHLTIGLIILGILMTIPHDEIVKDMDWFESVVFHITVMFYCLIWPYTLVKMFQHED